MHRALTSSSQLSRGYLPLMSLQGTPSSIICHKFVSNNKNNNNNNIGATENFQQRKYATKKPLFLRGKRGFKHYEKIKRVKNMSDFARREYLLQRERTKTIQWEPETGNISIFLICSYYGSYYYYYYHCVIVVH